MAFISVVYRTLALIIGDLTSEQLRPLPPPPPRSQADAQRRLVTRQDGFGGPDPGQRRAPDSFPVRVLVHGQFGREYRQQNYPERIPVPGHGLPVSHPVRRRLPAAAAAGVGRPADGAARQLLPLVHPASRLREVLCLRVGSLQYMEGARLVRTHR